METKLSAMTIHHHKSLILVVFVCLLSNPQKLHVVLCDTQSTPPIVGTLQDGGQDQPSTTDISKTPCEDGGNCNTVKKNTISQQTFLPTDRTEKSKELKNQMPTHPTQPAKTARRYVRGRVNCAHHYLQKYINQKSSTINFYILFSVSTQLL